MSPIPGESSGSLAGSALGSADGSCSSDGSEEGSSPGSVEGSEDGSCSSELGSPTSTPESSVGFSRTLNNRFSEQPDDTINTNKPCIDNPCIEPPKAILNDNTSGFESPNQEPSVIKTKRIYLANCKFARIATSSLMRLSAFPAYSIPHNLRLILNSAFKSYGGASENVASNVISF